MSQAAPTGPALRARIEAARAEARHPLTRPEVAEIVASVLRSMEGDVSGVDLKLYAELEALVRFIQHARAEIAAIRGDEAVRPIPAAADELDAVVGATEDATNRIMDSCDVVQAVAARVGGTDGEELVAAVTRIYEACNFQDITGQRIAKVVRTLKHIEARIESLVAALGNEVAKGGRNAGQGPGAPTWRGDDRQFLNGPPLPGVGIDQSEIDRLLGGG